MSLAAKQTMEIPNAIYESMLKVFIKMALKNKYQDQHPDRVHQTPKSGNALLKFNVN